MSAARELLQQLRSRLAAAQDAQQLGLLLWSQGVDRVEQSCPPAGGGPLAGPVAVGAGERTADVATELAVGQGRRHGAAGDCHQRLGEPSCKSRARCVLPRPDSPVSSTGTSCSATRASRSTQRKSEGGGASRRVSSGATDPSTGWASPAPSGRLSTRAAEHRGRRAIKRIVDMGEIFWGGLFGRRPDSGLVL
jgi:hypothetical protein